MQVQVIDPQGNLKLQNGSLTLLVSSNILMLTSTFFRRLLKEGGDFMESQHQPDRFNPPTHILHDEDPEAFMLMCKIPHFQCIDQSKDVQQLKSLADVCDYYGCQKAVSVHTQAWAKGWDVTDLANQALMDLLWAAYVFDLPETFALASVELAASLTSVEVDNFEVHLMPAVLKDDLKELRSRLHVSACVHVESIVEQVAKTPEIYIMTDYMVCGNCGIKKPLESKRCSPCGSREIVSDQCNLPKRLFLMFDWLRSVGLWPWTGCGSETNDGSFIDWVFYCTRPSKHACTGETSCPLSAQLQGRVLDGIHSTTKCTSGLRLSKLRSSIVHHRHQRRKIFLEDSDPVLSTKQKLVKIPSLYDQDAAFAFSQESPPEFEAKVYTSDPICIQKLPDSSSLLSGPGLSPPPPNRFRLVVHSRTQSVPPQLSQQQKNSYHKHSRSFQPGASPAAGIKIPAHIDDPYTPGLDFQGREADLQALQYLNNAEKLHDSHHNHRSVRDTGFGRLRNLRSPEQSQHIREEGEGAGRGGSRVDNSSTQTKCHRRQRTGVKIGITKDLISAFESASAAKRPQNTENMHSSLVQARIASFESLCPSREHLTRSATAPADLPSRMPTLEPPILFSTDLAYRRRWESPSLRELGRIVYPIHDSGEDEQDEEADLELKNEELLTMHSRSLQRPKPRRHLATQSASSRTITRAASVMYEPEALQSHKSQSDQQPPRPSSRARLVPANSHATMFPSAFRTVVVDEQERPGSSCSMDSSSTISDNGPPTPKSPGSSWLSWLTGTTPKRPSSPVSPTVCVSPAAGASLNPLGADTDDFGFTVAVAKSEERGIGDHWADTKRSLPKAAAGKRTVSKQVRWVDDESVRFSWF